jgi:hypothetical protein
VQYWEEMNPLYGCLANPGYKKIYQSWPRTRLTHIYQIPSSTIEDHNLLQLLLDLNDPNDQHLDSFLMGRKVKLSVLKKEVNHSRQKKKI